ncbi:MAG TPA: hypothetical protein VJ891_17580 [Casimicrobiaceae bacterium]|nr:hypothetical protein [Casimicrobiaceae bacterium]
MNDRHGLSRRAAVGSRARPVLHLLCASAVVLAVASFEVFAAAPNPASAQPRYPRYRLIDLGTLGGPNGSPVFPGVVLNDRGDVIAQAGTATPDPYPAPLQDDALVWHGILSNATGLVRDLGALPGTNHSLPGGISLNGLIAGFSTNGLVDPLTGFEEFRAVVWDRDLKIVDLGTLGGNMSVANQVNSQGLVVGAATNAIDEDPDIAGSFLFAPAAQQVRAVLWQSGTMRDLGTLGGNDANAVFVNESGAVTGISTTDAQVNDATGAPTTHPFVWKNGRMQDLGTLGGTFATTGTFIRGPWGRVMNEAGEVAGTSTLPGDDTWHAFLWSKGRMTDLGTLGGSISEAYAVNDGGQVVGRARLSDVPVVRHPFLWEKGAMIDLGTLDPCTLGEATSINANGQIVGGLGGCGSDPGAWTYFRSFYVEKGKPMVDLNSLVDPPSDLYIDEAMFINDRGEILAGAFTPAGHTHAVLLVPMQDH